MGRAISGDIENRIVFLDIDLAFNGFFARVVRYDCCLPNRNVLARPPARPVVAPPFTPEDNGPEVFFIRPADDIDRYSRHVLP